MTRRESGTTSPDKTYRMPAEWEPHEATWLGWPHELTDWPGKFAPIPWAFAEIVRHLSRVERVFLLVEDADSELRAKSVLQKSGVPLDAITFFRIPTDRGWMRDSGPIAVFPTPDSAADTVECGGLPPLSTAGHTTTEAGASSRTPHEGPTLLNFAFNGWAKYDDYKKDARVVGYANRKLRRPLILPEHKGTRIVLEGGAIDVNGRGSLLATEECLLDRVQERNPGFTIQDYAEIFRKYFAVTNVLWLKKGIAGDDTHGHIDDLARFVAPSTVVTVIENDTAKINYAPLQENLALLREMKDEAGEPLRVETLPMPEPVWFAGQLLPASYANFYIANKIVLVPTFNDPADRIALNTLAVLFRDREIVPIYCRDLVLGLGTIHCMTQQYPRA